MVIMKRSIFIVFALIVTLCLNTAVAATANLLDNGGFETSTPNALFGYTWDPWQCTAVTELEKTDILEGTQALRFKEASAARKFLQEVSMTEEADGQAFTLTIHYKVLSHTAQYPLSLACQWEHPTEGYLAHDEDILSHDLDPAVGTWQTVTVNTTKPKGANKLVVALAYAKNTLLLLDDWSLTRTEFENPDPWLTVTPNKSVAVQANVSESVLAQEFTIRKGHLTKPVSVYLTGTHKAMFSLDKEEITADEETLRLTYSPTAVGTHKAMLIVETSELSALTTTISIAGTASNPVAKPEITLSPSQLKAFSCVAGGYDTDSLLVSAINCSAPIEISMLNDQVPGAFLVNNTAMPANTQNGRSVITFHPLAAGEYSATVYYQTEGGTAKSIRLVGTATPDTQKKDTFATDFVFDNKNPKSVLIERFDEVGHNTPLALTDWQNVVKAGDRPWWGIDVVNEEPMYCAKATAFVSGLAEGDTWEQWLVTPALDYKNAVNQVFTFRVRGDYLFDDMTTALELYYVDALNSEDIYRQQLEVGIPATADEAGKWVDIHVDLSGQTTIADVFYMAFRYVGPSGKDGSPTYYVDDVTWGNPDLPVIACDSVQVTFTTEPGVAGAAEVKVTGKNLEQPIAVSLAGSNPGSFVLATATASAASAVELPAEGGALAIALLQEVEGVYEAYLTMSSHGAATLYVPLACLVKSRMALEDKPMQNVPVKRWVNGQILIRCADKDFNLLGMEK